MSKDRMSFDDACRELGISEEELEGLVASGEIASIKEGDSFFFKKEVVSQFKKNRKTEPTIILADEDMDLLSGLEEIDLQTPQPEAPSGLKSKAPAAKPPGAKAPAAHDRAAKDGSPKQEEASDIFNLDLEEETKDAAPAASPSVASRKTDPAPEDTVLNLDGLLEEDGSEGTTPIPGAEVSSRVEESADLTVEGSVNDETLLDTDLLEMGEEEDSFKLDAASEDATEAATDGSMLRGGGARVMQMKRKQSHPLVTTALVLSALLLLFPLWVYVNQCYVAAMGEGPLSVGPAGKDQAAPVYATIISIGDSIKGAFLAIVDLFA